jgi:hypothetical protein
MTSGMITPLRLQAGRYISHEGGAELVGEMVVIASEP